MIAQILGARELYGSETLVAQNIAFGIIAAIMLYSAFRVVTTKNVVHAALYLVIVLAGVAGQFVLLGAEFLAITQVLVYIGAVVVLFLFGIMLTKAKLGEDDGVEAERRGMASLVALMLFVLMGFAAVDSYEDQSLLFETQLLDASGDEVWTSIDGELVPVLEPEYFDLLIDGEPALDDAGSAVRIPMYEPLVYTDEAAEIAGVDTGDPVLHDAGDPVLDVYGDPIVLSTGEPLFHQQGDPVDDRSQPILFAPTDTDRVSDSIFGDYIVPFEVVSVLLLAALIGAIVVARKD